MVVLGMKMRWDVYGSDSGCMIFSQRDERGWKVLFVEIVQLI